VEQRDEKGERDETVHCTANGFAFFFFINGVKREGGLGLASPPFTDTPFHEMYLERKGHGRFGSFLVAFSPRWERNFPRGFFFLLS